MRRHLGLITAIILLAALILVMVIALRGPGEEELAGLEPHRRAGSAKELSPQALRNRDEPWARFDTSASAVAKATDRDAAAGNSLQEARAARDAGKPALDPKLARLRISVENVGAEALIAGDGGARAPNTIASRVIDSLLLDNKEGKAIGYRGNIDAIFPGPVVKPGSGNAVFGAAYEVKGRCQYVQDEFGEFCMHEETHSQYGNTKYDGIAYNGDYCYVDGQYAHRDLSGNKADESELGGIIRERQGVRFDPLVMRTLRELVASDTGSIAFEPVRGTVGGAEQYSILPLPPEQRTSPNQIKRLSGQARFSRDGLLEELVYAGEVVLGTGYMKGAPLTFEIHLAGIPEAELPPLGLP